MQATHSKGLSEIWGRPVILLTFLLISWASNPVHAQSYVVDGQISAQSAGNGTYNYTITLNNESSSMNPVGTFWFAWVPDYYGYDLLTSSPTSIQAPSGWSYYVTGPNNYYYPDGYGIQFYNYDSPMNPGSSLTFGFTSPDSPDMVEGTSQYFPDAATTSYVYSSYAEYDPGAEVDLTPVPEPSSLGLLAFGAVGLFVTRRRYLRAKQIRPVRICLKRQ